VAYYFLVAQLPHLSYGQQPPMSSAAFRELCATSLNKNDAALLPYCRLGIAKEDNKPTSSGFINEWRKREQTLVLNLAQMRSSKLKRDAPVEVSHDSSEAEALARAAFALDDPLEAELLLDRGRWDAVESLVGTDYFGVNTVYAYLLKLLLVERRSAFKTEEGFAEYKALYAGIIERAPRANGEPK
jgi:hypothetical protein